MLYKAVSHVILAGLSRTPRASPGACVKAAVLFLVPSPIFDKGWEVCHDELVPSRLLGQESLVPPVLSSSKGSQQDADWPEELLTNTRSKDMDSLSISCSYRRRSAFGTVE